MKDLCGGKIYVEENLVHMKDLWGGNGQILFIWNIYGRKMGRSYSYERFMGGEMGKSCSYEIFMGGKWANLVHMKDF